MNKKVVVFYIAAVAFYLVGIRPIYGQCNTLRPQIDITFNTDKDCAPTTVTDFTIKYFFNVAQNPADIVIRFEWNDPTNAITDRDIFSGLVVSGGDKEFQATGTFMYPVNNECSFFPTASVIINGSVCPTSTQEQTAFSWARDNEFGGVIDINPTDYEVCFGDAISNAIFADNSIFNCNINDEPDNPNRQERYVQFVYGTNHNAAASISDLTLNDGAVQTLTDGTGALTSSTTRGTAGLMITGAFFGPIDNIIFPADGPSSTTFPMSAPANALNAVGNQFEITMFNWNTCNPFNGSSANPNYDEAISITAYITIIAQPNPNFQTRKDNASGVITTDFCIGDDIYFQNLTAGGLSSSWEFFDDTVPTPPALATSNSNNPTYAFSTGGQKLARLTVSNPTAQGTCSRSFDLILNITPTVVASLNTTDFSDVGITPNFCQDNASSNTFEVRFYDNSVGVPNANTRYRWEFYDENNLLIREEPVGGYSTTLDGPFDQTYTTPGNYKVSYSVMDAITMCETSYDQYVRIFNEPLANFSASNICDGEEAHFENASSLSAINGDNITFYEWDFNYDGITFNKDVLFDNQTIFDRNIGATGSYIVALRVTTSEGCQNLIQKTVEVYPMPIATFSLDQSQGCSILPIQFTNTSVLAQPANVSNYFWEVDYNDGAGYIDLLTQNPLDASFQDVFTLQFENTTLVNKVADVRLRVVNEFNCESISGAQQIIIYPSPQSSFSTLNYNPFASNCGQLTVNFEVSALTQGLSPTQYTWRIEDENGLERPDQIVAPTTTSFSAIFTNTSFTDFKDYTVSLIADFPGGCPGTSSTIVRVNPIPSSNFTVNTLLIDCDIMKVAVEADQKGLAEYDWKMEVNNVLVYSNNTIGDKFEYEFNRPLVGNPNLSVSIELVTENFAGCKGILHLEQFDVPVKEDFGTSFTATPVSQIFPAASIALTNNSNPGTWNYLWDFGDGTSSTLEDPGNHEYTSPGNYIISLTLSNVNCSETVIQVVNVLPRLPIVDFAYTPSENCAPLTVVFTNLTQFAEPTSYVWDFGDGSNQSTDENPTHTYTQEGVYTVSLSASNSIGTTITETKVDILTVHGIPEALFTVDATNSFLPGDPLSLTNMSTGAINYMWDFGDGTTNVGLNPSHVYNLDGEYSIELIAVSSFNCTDTLTQEITINPVLPVVDFDFDPMEGCAPVTVTFTNTTKFALEDSYVWDFGDGGTSNAKNPTYTYFQPGKYTVSLRATNAAGDVGSTLKQEIVIVYANPVALFEVRPTQVYLPSPIYTNNRSFDANSFLWDFGDGNTSNEFEPTHVYDQENTNDRGETIGYDISLIAIGEFGCTDTTTVINAVIALERGDILVPNAFSPSLSGPGNQGAGNDGSNDVFLPLVRNTRSFHMLIFNRWGELLFESNDSTIGWDGYYKGRLVPQDVYAYKLNVTLNNGDVESRIGDITLIR